MSIQRNVSYVGLFIYPGCVWGHDVTFRCELLCTLKCIFNMKYIRLFLKFLYLNCFHIGKISIARLASVIFCNSQWQWFFTRNIRGYFLVEKISRRSVKKGRTTGMISGSRSNLLWLQTLQSFQSQAKFLLYTEWIQGAPYLDPS